VISFIFSPIIISDLSSMSVSSDDCSITPVPLLNVAFPLLSPRSVFPLLMFLGNGFVGGQEKVPFMNPFLFP